MDEKEYIAFLKKRLEQERNDYQYVIYCQGALSLAELHLKEIHRLQNKIIAIVEKHEQKWNLAKTNLLG